MGQDCDVSLKLLFRRSNGVAIQRLLGERVAEWLNVELPRVRNPRVDMLARMESGVLTHLDLQSANHPAMARREAEYYLDLHRLMGEHVRQVVLYVGAGPLAMSTVFQTPVMNFHYELVDIREFEPETLLASDDLGDRMLALLTLVDKERVGEVVWPEIEKMPSAMGVDVVTEFLIISGLRGLEDWVLERARTLMPLSFDIILQNKVLGPMVQRHLEEGRQQIRQEARQEGLQEGRQEGRQEGEVAILRRLLESRFGALPPTYSVQLEHASEERLNTIADRALTATTVEEVFRSS